MTKPDIQCEKMYTYNDPCDHCGQESEYQIWDEKMIDEMGEVEILVACTEHTKEVKSELYRKQQR
jgi:alpha-D-ribose 1-methylphosphonate 5-phosphate C-P lyase